MANDLVRWIRDDCEHGASTARKEFEKFSREKKVFRGAEMPGEEGMETAYDVLMKFFQSLVITILIAVVFKY